MKLRCVIVDDEPYAIKVVENYATKVPFLEVVGTFNSALEALEAIPGLQTDLLFLDINMPELSGIDMLKAMKTPPPVIVTTAYPEHAVEGYELEVLDYLLKPFSFERFLKSVERVRSLQNLKAEGLDQSIFLKVDKKQYKTALTDILFLEAHGDYVKVHTKEKMYLTKSKLTDFEERLPTDQFMRVHRSFIISLDALKYIEGNQIVIESHKVPVSESYRKELQDWVDKRG